MRRRKMRTALVAVVLTVGTAGAWVRTTGADFMKIPTSGRVAGMGGTCLSFVDDIDALDVNPGGLSYLDRIQVMYNHTEWLSGGTGARYEAFGVATPLRAFDNPSWKRLEAAFGAVVQVFYVAPFQQFDDWGVEVGRDLRYSAFKMRLGYAMPVFRSEVFDVRGGANLGLVTTSPSGRGIAKPSLDAGAVATIRHGQPSLTRYIGETFKAALVLQNIDFYSTGVNNNLPFGVKFGFGARVYDMVDVALDFSKTLDESLFSGSLGAEYWLKDIVAFRLGTSLAPDKLGFLNAGLGFKYKFGRYRVRFDYALLPYFEIGQAAHQFVLKAETDRIEIRIPDRTDLWYYRGIDLFLNKRYAEAIEMWERVLRKNPNREDAKARIEEARRIIELEKQQQEFRNLEEGLHQETEPVRRR